MPGSSSNSTPDPIEVRTDVTEAVGAGLTLQTVATVWLPDPARLAARPIVAFGFPGVGYNRAYYSFDMPGSSFGGQAGYHVENQGWIFIACDHLGVGDSSVPDRSVTALPAVLAANGATVDNILNLLAEGTLSEGFPRVTRPVCVGIGHSMGGNLTIALQGTAPRFDGVAMLGYSAIQTVLPKPGGPGLTFTSAPGDNLDNNRDVILRYAFHWDDVPEEIVIADVSDYPTAGPTPTLGQYDLTGLRRPYGETRGDCRGGRRDRSAGTGCHGRARTSSRTCTPKRRPFPARGTFRCTANRPWPTCTTSLGTAPSFGTESRRGSPPYPVEPNIGRHHAQRESLTGDPGGTVQSGIAIAERD